MLNSLFDKLWGMDGIHPFGHPDLLESFLGIKYEDLDEEVFEVVKGDYKTTIICKFNKKGYLVSHSSSSHLIIDDTMIKLKEQLEEALCKEDYEEAVKVQKLINTKREAEERKPTL